MTCQPVLRRPLRSAAVLGLNVPVRPQLVDAFAEKHPEVAEKARNKAFRRAQDQINVGAACCARSIAPKGDCSGCAPRRS